MSLPEISCFKDICIRTSRLIIIGMIFTIAYVLYVYRYYQQLRQKDKKAARRKKG